jgi:hypothetical protein
MITRWCLVLACVGCGGTLDAGHDRSHGPLPVDERNPVILANDNWNDNWAGEYAVLLANSDGPPLAGIVAGTSKYWGSATDNAAGWSNLVAAARDSGLRNIPDVTMSNDPPLVKPDDGQIDSTEPNNSAGANRIINLSLQFSKPGRPVAVVVGAPLTMVADAYLIDNSVVDRVVIVAALGKNDGADGTMDGPNGDLDPWADWIVAQRFRYVQVCAYYDQTSDIAASDIDALPNNPFGNWIKNKQPKIYAIPTASDQVAVLSVALPTFATTVQRGAPDTTGGFDSTQGPPLVPSANGNAWVVSGIAAPLAKSRLWDLLLAPTTFGP